MVDTEVIRMEALPFIVLRPKKNMCVSDNPTDPIFTPRLNFFFHQKKRGETEFGLMDENWLRIHRDYPLSNST